MKFVECWFCQAKPGTPQLCSGCIVRRLLCEALNECERTVPENRLQFLHKKVTEIAESQWDGSYGHVDGGPFMRRRAPGSVADTIINTQPMRSGRHGKCEKCKQNSADLRRVVAHFVPGQLDPTPRPDGPPTWLCGPCRETPPGPEDHRGHH